MKATYAVLAACIAVCTAAPNQALPAPNAGNDIVVGPKVISAETDVFVHPRVGQGETDVFIHPRVGQGETDVFTHPRVGQGETDVFVHPRVGQGETDVFVHPRVGQGETDVFVRPEPVPGPVEAPCGPALPARTAGIDNDVFVHPRVEQGVIDVWPNPSSGVVNLGPIHGPTLAEPVARLYDPQGRVVADLKPGANDLSRVARGSYFVRAGGTGSATKLTLR